MSKVIKRKRYVIVRDGTHIMCGLARQYYFKPITDIGNTTIKTYLSEKKAIAGFKKSWNLDIGGRYEVVEVEEVVNIKGDLHSGGDRSKEQWEQLTLESYLNG